MQDQLGVSQEIIQAARELNLSYLLLAQHMLREDKAAGMFRLGLSESIADLIINLSSSQVVRLALADQLLSLSPAGQKIIASAIKQGERRTELAALHSEILSAGQPATPFS